MKNLVMKTMFVLCCLIPWACSRQFVSQPQPNWLYTPTPTSTPVATATAVETRKVTENFDRWRAAARQVNELEKKKDYDGAIKLGTQFRDD